MKHSCARDHNSHRQHRCNHSRARKEHATKRGSGHLQRPGQARGHHEGQGHDADGAQQLQDLAQVRNQHDRQIDGTKKCGGQSSVHASRDRSRVLPRHHELQAQVSQRQNRERHLQDNEAAQQGLNGQDAAALAAPRGDLRHDVGRGAAAKGGVSDGTDEEVERGDDEAGGRRDKRGPRLQFRLELSVNLRDVHVAEHGTCENGHGQHDRPSFCPSGDRQLF
mmetsp:Transcript_117373/g.374058  ORF Transcript_117373/g.374058 Transcript_117373/m.374058 type:complete len:222 (-) Transcript_117373:697-1362(-)